jgi:hypothetical protein
MADIREQISGIGAMSKRTDLNVSQQPARYISGLPAAPMQGMPTTPMPDIVGLTEPTQRPNEPITAGVDFGPGPNSSIINLPNTKPTTLSVLRQIAQNDPSGETDLIFQAFLEKGL